MGKIILWGANKYGYSVQIWVDGEMTREYNAGNNRHESCGVIEPSSPNAVAPELLREWAVQTSGEFDQEEGGGFEISEDPSIAPEYIDAH